MRVCRRLLVGAGMGTVLVLVGCRPAPPPSAPPAPTATEPVGTARYWDTAHRFSIAIPSAWQVQPGYLGTTLSAFGPAPAEGLLQPSVKVTIEAVAPEVTLDDYAQHGQARLEASIDRFRITAAGDGQLGAEPARWLQAIYHLDNREVTTRVTFTIHDALAVAVVETADPQHFQSLEPSLRELVASFRFESAAP